MSVKRYPDYTRHFATAAEARQYYKTRMREFAEDKFYFYHFTFYKGRPQTKPYCVACFAGVMPSTHNDRIG
jgi:hypothetical protein